MEVYYKWIKDYLDYKSGASLVMNHHIETDVFNTKGKAYGAEFMIKKPAGKLAEVVEVPDGWKMISRHKKRGITKGRVDKYWISPEGIKYNSLKKLQKVLKKNLSKKQTV